MESYNTAVFVLVFMFIGLTVSVNNTSFDTIKEQSHLKSTINLDENISEEVSKLFNNNEPLLDVDSHEYTAGYLIENSESETSTNYGLRDVTTRHSSDEGKETVYGKPLSQPEKVLEPDHKKEADSLSDHFRDKSSAEINSNENTTEVSHNLLADENKSDENIQNSDEHKIKLSDQIKYDDKNGVSSAMNFIMPEKISVDGTELSIIPLAVDEESSVDSSEENLETERKERTNSTWKTEKKSAYSPERLVMNEERNISEDVTTSFYKEDVLKEVLETKTTSRVQIENSPTTLNLKNGKVSTHHQLISSPNKELTVEQLHPSDFNSLSTHTSSSTFWEQDNFTSQHPETVISTEETHDYGLKTDYTTLAVPTTKIIHTYPAVNSHKFKEELPLAEKYYSHYNEHDFIERNQSERSEFGSRRNESISQHLRDFEDKSEEDKTVLKSLLEDYPSFKKEKIEPGVLFEECPDCDLRVLPIRPAEQRSMTEEDESLPQSKIRFADLPEGSELQITKLGLSDGIFLFSYLSQFLSWIQPNDFPVDLLRETLKNQISWVSLIMQSLQVEAGFVACLVVGVLLALAVPVVVLSHTCYRMGGRPENADEGAGWAGSCKRRTLVFILQILLVLLLAGMVAMFVTNEQLSSAVVQSSEVLQTSLADVSGYVHDSHLQLHFLVTQSMDQAIQAIHADLDNVDSLLGRPIQRELVRETGLDVALDTLSDLTRETKETTQQVERFLDELRVTQEMLTSSREKLSDLRQQVELFRRACGVRDRPLCDTIDASGLDITLRVDMMKSDERLNKMRRMGGVGLEVAMKEAKEHYMNVPNRVDTDTRDERESVRRQLARHKAEVETRSEELEKFARSLTSKVNEAKYQTGFWMEDVDQIEYWRWIACVGGGAAVLMIWMLLLCSMCCGCCGSERAAGPTILVTVVLVCLFSTVLWTAALVGLLVGGHGEVFLCRPLYDEPQYDVISRLVDEPGVFYTDQRGGFIANVIYGNDSLDVPIRQLLQDCQNNRPIYSTLGLNRIFDVENAVDQQRWGSISTQLRGIRANLSSLEVLSPHLQNQLADLLAIISVNFTEHRIQMSKPLTGKDLDSFARQLDNIGNQMRDLATASRMETLSSRTRRLIDTHIRPLEGKKDALVYQLTALEVQTGPLQRQVNQSLSHLKTIQFFVNSQGEAIAQRKSREYVERLVSYLHQMRHHVVESLQQQVAPCRPLWDIFNNTRLFLCRHTMDPLNGYWFATMWCLVVLLVATPVCLKLVDYYRAHGSRSSGSPESLVVAEQGNGWSSPGYDIKHSKESNGFVK